MNKITTNTHTEHYAKRIAIGRAITFFQENVESYFVELEVTWSDTRNNIYGYAKIAARREVISQFYGVDFVRSQKRDLSKFQPRTKEDFDELWTMLETNSLET